jgi:hypothetical protein
MVSNCPKCGFENVDQTYYCNKCGANIREFSFESQIYKKIELPPHYDTTMDRWSFSRGGRGWFSIVVIGAFVIIFTLTLGIAYAILLFMENQYPGQRDLISIIITIILCSLGIAYMFAFSKLFNSRKKHR